MLSFLYGPNLTTIHDYWKSIALTRWIFVGKVMSLLFNILSRLVIAFLPRSKCLLISWLQSLSAVILDPKKIKSVTVSIVSPSICHEVMEPDAMILAFWMLSFKPRTSGSRKSVVVAWMEYKSKWTKRFGAWRFSWQHQFASSNQVLSTYSPSLVIEAPLLSWKGFYFL